jgi:pyridoxal phosphate enzyme (YggS family)
VTSRERRRTRPANALDSRPIHDSRAHELRGHPAGGLPGARSRLEHVRARIAAAARDAGRSAGDVQLVAVTKSVHAEQAAALVELGVHDLGESRLQELEAKARALDTGGAGGVRWHFVGHLQRNKARGVLRLAHAIHSVDSRALWAALARAAAEEGCAPGIYLQVKLAPDATKGGLAPAEVAELVAEARTGPLPLLGLMAMAPLAPLPSGECDQPRVSRPVFDAAAALARTLPADAFAGGRVRLSMGMSQDFEEAVRAGADVVRVGSALFDGAEAEITPEGHAR